MDPLSTAPDGRHAVIIRNPAARRTVSAERLRKAARPLRAAGWRIDLLESAARGDVSRLAEQAAQADADVVAVCGGDGTINEAIQTLAGSASALAVVPAGTANVWASEVGIPGDPERALVLLQRGRRRMVDLGVARIGEAAPRRFLLMCSAGMDGDVIERVERRPVWKRRAGRAAFVPAAVGALARLTPATAQLELDGESERVDLLWTLAGNTRLYGSVARFTGGAVADDGYLDIVTIVDPAPAAPRRRLRYARLAAGLAGGGWRGDLARRAPAGVRYRRVRSLSLEPGRRIPVQLDGELLGVCDPAGGLRIGIEPSALQVITPAGAHPLFGREDAAGSPAAGRA